MDADSSSPARDVPPSLVKTAIDHLRYIACLVPCHLLRLGADTRHLVSNNCSMADLHAVLCVERLTTLGAGATTFILLISITRERANEHFQSAVVFTGS